MLVLLLKKRYKMICRVIGILAVSMVSNELCISICSYFSGMTENLSFMGKILLMIKEYSGYGQGTRRENIPSFLTYGILHKLNDLGVSSYIV